MVLVVLGSLDLFRLDGLVQDAFILDAVVFAVFPAAFLAETAIFAELQPQSLGAAAAPVADPSLADAAFGAVVTVFLTLAVFLEAFSADFAVFPTVFALTAVLAVFKSRAVRAAFAVLADIFAAVDAVLAFIGALTDVCVAIAAFRAMISAAFSALLADAAGFAKLNALAERAFAAFRTEEFLVAIDAMLAAVGARLGLLVEIFVIDHVDAAVCAHLVGAVLLKVC